MGKYIGKEIGIFKIVRELKNTGGQGLVYEAEIYNDVTYPERNGFRVVLKFARTGDRHEQTYREILLDEARTLLKFHHPSVVRLVKPNKKFNWGTAVELEGHPAYFAMEYLQGDDLKTFIEKKLKDPINSHFSIKWRVELIYKIAQTLAYIHASRLTHRDLKPENIVFRDPPEPGKIPQPVLIDFGLAQQIESSDSGTATPSARMISQRDNALSPLYTPCERFKALERASMTKGAFDYRAHDVWAFGAIAYEILNGKHILASRINSESSPHDIRSCVCSQRHDPMHSSLDSYPLLQELIEATLLFNPDDRTRMSHIVKHLEQDIEILAPRI